MGGTVGTIDILRSVAGHGGARGTVITMTVRRCSLGHGVKGAVITTAVLRCKLGHGARGAVVTMAVLRLGLGYGGARGTAIMMAVLGFKLGKVVSVHCFICATILRSTWCEMGIWSVLGLLS